MKLKPIIEWGWADFALAVIVVVCVMFAIGFWAGYLL